MGNTLIKNILTPYYMKKLLSFILLLATTLNYSQKSSGVSNGQNVYSPGQPRAIMSCDTLPSGLFRIYPKAQVTWKFIQITDKPTTLSGYGILDGVTTSALTWTNITGKPLFSSVATSGNYLDLINQPIIPTNNNQLSNGAGFITASSADILTNKSGNVSQFTNDAGYVTSIPVNSVFGRNGNVTAQNGDYTTSQVTEGANQYFTTARARASVSAGTGIGYNPTNGIFTNTAPDQTVTLTSGNRISITGTYPNFTISYIEPTVNIVARTLNSNFTPSSTKQSFVTYSVTCSVTNPLLAGSSTANVFLEYSTNGGSSWVLPSQNGNSSSVGVAVAIAITNGQTVTVSGYIPAGGLVRLRTATTGTANVTYVTGQETY